MSKCLRLPFDRQLARAPESAKEGPHDKRDGCDYRSNHEDVIEGAALVLARRVESHISQYGGR